MTALEILQQKARAFEESIPLLAAADLGLFDALQEGPRETAALAGDLSVSPRGLDILLHALAAEGYLVKQEGAFGLAEAYAPYLLSDSKETLISILRHRHSCMRSWARLREVLLTDKPAETEETAEHLENFILGMANVSRSSSREVAEKLPLARYKKMLDLGGGPATASMAFCRANPELQAVVLDLEPVTEIARREIARAGLQDRIATQPGDALADAYGTDYDLVYVSNILHMFGEADARRIIEKSAAALSPGGDLVIKDFLLEEDRLHPAFGALFSVNMLVRTREGRSYTRGEVQAMLEDAGFADFQCHTVASHSSLLVGTLAP